MVNAPPSDVETNLQVNSRVVELGQERAMSPVDIEPVQLSCTGDKALEHAHTATRRVMKISGLALFVIIFLFSFFGWPSNVIEEEGVHGKILAVLFLTGILLVALEDVVRLDKSAIMLTLASVMWTYHAASLHPTRSEEEHETFEHELAQGLEDVGKVILFLLPAMCLVESIDHMKGFAVVTRFIVRCTKEKPGRLMPIVCVLAFFLSSLIDNLTATIVCIKILQRVVPHNQDWRHSCGGLVVVAANAGGAWSPIGDVTTTMLWLQHKVSTTGIVIWTFLPSFVAGVVPLFGIWWQAKRCGPKHAEEAPEIDPPVASRNSKIVLVVGIACILMVPIVKVVTALPPYLGMMLALGVFWLVSEMADLAAEEEAEAADEEHGPEEVEMPHGPHKDGVPAALRNVDLTSLLFFTGVLLGVACLESAEVLEYYTEAMRQVTHGSNLLLAALLGVSSAVVDNVPLVQASMDFKQLDGTPVPRDDPLWHLVALAAGTGGSMLAVGSVAGVTLMGLEHVGFLWYAKRISPWAALGFALGLATYQVQLLIIQAAQA